MNVHNGQCRNDRQLAPELPWAGRVHMPLLLAGKRSEPIEVAYFDREVKPRLRPSDRLLGEADAATKRQLWRRHGACCSPSSGRNRSAWS
jgi:hypothetical protein